MFAALGRYLFGVAVNTLAASWACPAALRVLVYRALGLDVSLGARVEAHVVVRARALSVGRASTVNHSCVFDNRAEVRIGERCGIGIGVRFVTSDHDLSDPACRAGAGSLRPISIGDGAWIGSGATVLAGVRVGAGAVVAAGSLVRADVAPHTLVGGVPARALRDLAQEPAAGAR